MGAGLRRSTAPRLPARNKVRGTMLPRVLVAETHPQLGALIDKGLRRHRLVPTVVTTAADVVAAALSGDYAVVVLDLDDEQRGTLAVLHEVRAAGCTAAVLALAGRHGPRDRASALAAGADEFADAPLRFATLVPLIHDLLARRH